MTEPKGKCRKNIFSEEEWMKVIDETFGCWGCIRRRTFAQGIIKKIKKDFGIPER